MKKDNGFTFIEILISLIILVILFMMTKSISNYHVGMKNEVLAKRANMALVGYLEKQQLKFSEQAISLQELSASEQFFETVTLDSGDRKITGKLSYEPVTLVDSKVTKKDPDYFLITGFVNYRDFSGRNREIKLTIPSFRTKE